MKTAEELFNELKDESFVFYGSGAEGYYSGAEAFSGLVFTKKEFDEINKYVPEQLPDTEDYFSELDGKHSEVEGEEFCKHFDTLEDYYIWYMNNNVDLDSPYYQALEGMDEKFLKTSNYLHSLQNWRVESVFDYIQENYEVKQVATLIKKETDIYLHSLQNWRMKSVFDYIQENYEVKQVATLIKKETDYDKEK